jgi:hypothetical protein
MLFGPATTVQVNGTIVIVIDALDESGIELERRTLLNVLFDDFLTLPPNFRVFITCRPEQDIMAKLERVNRNGQRIRIHMPSFRYDEESDLAKDMLTYIDHQLRERTGELPDDLPDCACEQLRDQAAGVFQWAYVACQYIDQTSGMVTTTAKERHALLLSGRPGNIGLDDLYKTILQRNLFDTDPDAITVFKAVVGFIFAARQPLRMDSLDELFPAIPAVPRDRPHHVLSRLGSVFSGVTDKTAPVRPLHSSFSEYLQDPTRGPYHVEVDGHHENHVVGALTLFDKTLRFNMFGFCSSYTSNTDDHISLRNGTRIVNEGVRYACKNWGQHFAATKIGGDSESRMLHLYETLLKTNFLFLLEAGSMGQMLGDIAGSIGACLPRLEVGQLQQQQVHC